MKRIKYAALILCCCLTLSACGEKGSNTSQDADPKTSTETSTPSGSVDEKEQSPLHVSLDDLVQEAEFSAKEVYRFPKLNEELLGDVAKEYNRKIKEAYEEVKESYEGEKEGPYYEEIAKDINYFAFIDEERGWFSIVSRYMDLRGYFSYQPLTLNLHNNYSPVSFETAMRAYGWTEKDLRQKIEDYHQRMYVWDLTDYYRNNYNEDITPLGWDEFFKQRMGVLSDELQGGLPYSLGEKGLTVYYSTSLPSFPEGYEEALLLQKTGVEELLNNHTYGSLAAIIHRVDDAERNQANIIEKIHPDESGTEKLIIALTDDVILSVERVKYDEVEGVYVIEEELFRKKMVRGETISLKTILPEGFANIQISGEHFYNPYNELESNAFHHALLKQGIYADPSIELLEGFYVNG